MDTSHPFLYIYTHSVLLGKGIKQETRKHSSVRTHYAKTAAGSLVHMSDSSHKSEGNTRF